jgi:8-oxo-dGTP pyrophosphatase MutT (NUDIX family)
MENRKHIEKYLEWLASLPVGLREVGSRVRGEIELVTDPRVMEVIETQEINGRLMRGLSVEQTHVGIIYESPVFWLVQDPVRLPDGSCRLWQRLVWRNGVHGKSVVIVPYTDDKRLLFVPAYRHVSRRWELELPGGGSTAAVTYAEAVHGEMFEEAGYEALEIKPLEAQAADGSAIGYFFVDPSTNGTPIRSYAVRLGKRGVQAPEDGEIFGRPVLLTRVEIERAFRVGSYPHPDHLDVACHIQRGRNGYGILLAILHGLI